MATYIAFGRAVFWAMFIAIGALFYLRIWADIILGFAVVLLGILMLRFELEVKRRKIQERSIRQTMDSMMEWMVRENELLKAMESKYDSRIFNLTKKHADLRKTFTRFSRRTSLKLGNQERILGRHQKAFDRIERSQARIERLAFRTQARLDRVVRTLRRI